MQIADKYPELWAGIQKSVLENRLAHAYVIVGSPRGDGLAFTEAFLQLLFCEAEQKPCGVCNECYLVQTHKHVDVFWLEPQSKSRQIKVDEIRDLVKRMNQTSFEGGWKAAVILAADCMNAQSANALLKTLEEPPQKTLILLVTDSPQALLPTIISRCQRLTLSVEDSDDQELWYEPLLEILREMPPSSGLAAFQLASRFKKLLDQIKERVSDEISEQFNPDEAIDESKRKEIFESRVKARLKEVQARLFRIILDWYRDLLVLVSTGEEKELIFADEQDVLFLQTEKYTREAILKAIKNIEQMIGRLNQNLPVMHILDAAFRALIIKK